MRQNTIYSTSVAVWENPLGHAILLSCLRVNAFTDLLMGRFTKCWGTSNSELLVQTICSVFNLKCCVEPALRVGESVACLPLLCRSGVEVAQLCITLPFRKGRCGVNIFWGELKCSWSGEQNLQFLWLFFLDYRSIFLHCSPPHYPNRSLPQLSRIFDQSVNKPFDDFLPKWKNVLLHIFENFLKFIIRANWFIGIHFRTYLNPFKKHILLIC